MACLVLLLIVFSGKSLIQEEQYQKVKIPVVILGVVLFDLWLLSVA
jgi:hypothetical protein